MKDIGEPFPAHLIPIGDAFDLVYRALNPGFEILEQRLSLSDKHYDAFQGKDVKDRANLEAWANFDQAQRHANEWIRGKMCQGVLIVWVWDREKKEEYQLSRHPWASMSDFEMMGVFETGKATVSGEKRDLYFNRESFDHVMKEITPPDGNRDAHPGESAPAASKRKSTQEAIREVYARLWPNGYSGRAKHRNDAIRQDFKDRDLHQPADRSIQRALSGK
jgi:hypothetical protein